jgi:heme exporter protein CcmD
MSEFWSMSGYGGYVWSCYGLALIVLVANVWAARRRLREEIVQAKRRVESRREAQS